MKPSGNRELKTDLPKYYNALLDHLGGAIRCSEAVESQRRNLVTSAEPYIPNVRGDAERDFMHHLSVLYRLMKPKLQYQKKAEIDDELRQKIDENGVRDLDFDEANELLDEIHQAMEAIGITSLEQEEWVKQGI